jgi:hypothetical protein
VGSIPIARSYVTSRKGKMKKNTYAGTERRKFIRLEYISPLAYKVCREETISKLLEGYTSNVSEAGLLCRIKDKVKLDDILWLSFDRGVLGVCEDLEKRSLIYQNGVVGKVVRIDEKNNDMFLVGVQFITREEKNLTNIYPKVHFLALEDEQKEE